MNQTRITVRVYHQFPPKESKTARNQVTLEQVQKYLSGKPLRFGQSDTQGKHGRFDLPGPEADTDMPGGPSKP